jgi:hypothetical protein
MDTIPIGDIATSEDQMQHLYKMDQTHIRSRDNQIGQGSYGSVFLLDTAGLVRKDALMTDIASVPIPADFVKEVVGLSMLRHARHVVTIRGFDVMQGSIFLDAARGSLHDHITNQGHTYHYETNTPWVA